VLLPDGDWLYLEGEVRHHRPGFGFGVRFLDLNDEQREKLLLLLEIANAVGPKAPSQPTWSKTNASNRLITQIKGLE
jgi:hypothetical protein